MSTLNSMSGRGAGVARTFGVGEAGGSNPLVPTINRQVRHRAWPFFFALTHSDLNRYRLGFSHRVESGVVIEPVSDVTRYRFRSDVESFGSRQKGRKVEIFASTFLGYFVDRQVTSV